jgi:hypothetical protein
MIVKPGRKRKNELYFGPEVEEAVVKFLSLRYVEIIDLEKDKPITIKHNLGKIININTFIILPNPTAYGKDDKFIKHDVNVNINYRTNTSFNIVCKDSIQSVNVVVTNDIERNLVFNKHLNAPLNKMIESIIRKYKLYRKGFTFEELHGDTVSFLMTQVHKFDIKQNKKAYSYFGTIVKHYVLGLLNKDGKSVKQLTPYDDVAKDVEERDDLKYTIDEEHFDLDGFLLKLVDGVKEELNTEHKSAKKKLNENERKVGLALVELLENWETAFESMKGGAKYNKNSVLETMRNYTNLSTKDIRLAMKRYKDLYEILRKHGL